MKGIYIYSTNTIFLSKHFLLKYLPKKTVEKWNGKTTTRKIIEGQTFHEYDSIPNYSKSKLPTTTDIKAFLNDDLANDFLDKIEKYHRKNFQSLLSDYRRNYPTLSEGRHKEYAQKHCAWTFIITVDTSKNGYLQALQKAYNSLYPLHAIESKTAFCNHIKRAKENIGEYVVHGNVGKQNAQKTTDLHTYMALQSKSLGLGLTPNSIQELLKPELEKLGQKVPSPEWFKKALKKHSNILKGDTYGEIEGRKAKHFLPIQQAENPNDQWQLDAYTIPNWYTGQNGKVEKLVLVAIVDTCTKYIIGYHITERENTDSILKALERATNEAKALPFELVADNHSFNQTQQAKDLKTEFEARKIHYTITENPQHKSIVERLFQTMHTKTFSLEPNNNGEGVKSRRRSQMVNKENHNLYYKETLTKEQIKQIGFRVVEAHNQTVREAYKQGLKPNQCPIDECDIVKLFCKETEHTVTRSGIITISRGNTKRYYSLPKSLNWNGQKVKVFSTNDYETIHVFDSTGNYKGELLEVEKAHGALANQTPRDKQLFSHNALEHKAVKKEKTDTLRDIAKGALEQAEKLQYDLQSFDPLVNRKTQFLDDEAKYRVSQYLIEEGIDPEKDPYPIHNPKIKERNVMYKALVEVSEPTKKEKGWKGELKPLED